MRRLRRDAPSITIDTGHNVYFHPEFNRVPTIRESARLQSFPDSFIPDNNDHQAYKQFGNAVNVNVIKYVAHKLFNLKED